MREGGNGRLGASQHSLNLDLTPEKRPFLQSQLTPGVTCGLRRARALRAPPFVTAVRLSRKARDRPDRQVDALVVRLLPFGSGVHSCSVCLMRTLVGLALVALTAGGPHRAQRCVDSDSDCCPNPSYRLKCCRIESELLKMWTQPCLDSDVEAPGLDCIPPTTSCYW